MSSVSGGRLLAERRCCVALFLYCPFRCLLAVTRPFISSREHRVPKSHDNLMIVYTKMTNNIVIIVMSQKLYHTHCWQLSEVSIQLCFSNIPGLLCINSKKKYFQAPFLVLQLVTNRGLYLVPGRTKWYLEAPWQVYWGPDGLSLGIWKGINGVWQGDAI